MPDDNLSIECPSCGHSNASYVDKCIICDFSLSLYRNQIRTRNAAEAKALENDESIAQAGKLLSQLPASDMLADKNKKKGKTSKISQCSECGESYRIGAFMCQNCGARLPQDESLGDLEEETSSAQAVTPEEQTQSVHQYDNVIKHPTETPAISVSQILDAPVDVIPDQCMKFTSWMILRFDIVGFDTPIILRPLQDKPMLIGRRHESLSIQPHIDLTAYLQDRHGVSRRHALLRLRGTRLELQDLASTNGTSINGVRFSPKESHQLRHQDVIMIGQIQMRLSFGHQVRSASHGHTEELM